MFLWWLAQVPPPAAPDLTISEYGPLGAVLGLAVAAVVILFRREIAAHERERTRGDRLEAALTARNAAQEQELRDAIRALEDAMAQVRRLDR